MSHNSTSSFHCRQLTFQASKLLLPATECGKVTLSVVSVCSHGIPHVITTSDDIGQSQVTWTPQTFSNLFTWDPPPALVPPCCNHTGIPSSLDLFKLFHSSPYFYQQAPVGLQLKGLFVAGNYAQNLF